MNRMMCLAGFSYLFGGTSFVLGEHYHCPGTYGAIGMTTVMVLAITLSFKEEK